MCAHVLIHEMGAGTQACKNDTYYEMHCIPKERKRGGVEDERRQDRGVVIPGSARHRLNARRNEAALIPSLQVLNRVHRYPCKWLNVRVSMVQRMDVPIHGPEMKQAMCEVKVNTVSSKKVTGTIQ